MKHQLVNRLRAENKKLKAQIRNLENKKSEHSDSMSTLTDIEALKEHFKRNKYA